MDSCFNKNIPETTHDTFILKPVSKTWINGLANTYDSTYFTELEPFIDKLTFRNCICKINDDLYTMWPCPTCFAFGYCCCLCTVGLSFLCPYTCISDAKKSLLDNVDRFNQNVFNPRGLELTFEKLTCTSFLQIRIVDSSKARGKGISNYNNNINKNTDTENLKQYNISSNQV